MNLEFVLLISVVEKDQVMHTNVWLTLKWFDHQMVWNPMTYGGITTIRVPPDKVWGPDVVLFNNMDGVYDVAFFSNVVVEHTGEMLWVPPAIYKSACIIDVEHFPFDRQYCKLKFGSWTYNSSEIVMKTQIPYVNMEPFNPSSIWDVEDCPASLTKNRSRIVYGLQLRRKPLFYTVVLLIPTILMAFLSMAVFYLPTDAGEKMSLSISILLSLVVFMLLLTKILPPTSDKIPLLAKYLLLTFVLNVITIMITVCVINVFFRAPSTHTMPKWTRTLFLSLLPQLLLMKRPKRYKTASRVKDSSQADGGLVSDEIGKEDRRAGDSPTTTSSSYKLEPFRSYKSYKSHKLPPQVSISSLDERLNPPGSLDQPDPNNNNNPTSLTFNQIRHFDHHPMCIYAQQQEYHQRHHHHQQQQHHNSQHNTESLNLPQGNYSRSLDSSELPPAGEARRRHRSPHRSPRGPSPKAPREYSDSRSRTVPLPLSHETYRALVAVDYITQHLREDDRIRNQSEDWKYAAMVIDRIMLYVFFAVTIAGTVMIIFAAPDVFAHYDQTALIQKIASRYANKPVDIVTDVV